MTFDCIRTIHKLLISSRTQYNKEVRDRYLHDRARNIHELCGETSHELYLDVGSGSESLAGLFSTDFHEIVLLDIDNRVLKVAKSMSPNFSFVCGDAHCLPFKDKTFSSIGAYSLVEHLRQPLKFLREVQRVLSPEGVFIAQIPNIGFFIELHTGIILPVILPSCFKDVIVRRTFPWVYINWGVNEKALAHDLNRLFFHVGIAKLDYPEESVVRLFSPLFRIARKLRILELCPMAYIIWGKNAF